MIYFNSEHIFLATLGAYIVGALWFSPLLFQKAWMKAYGLTKENLPKRGRVYMIRGSIYSFIAHGCIVAVIAFLFDLLQMDTLKTMISLSLLLTLGFIVSTKFIDLVYSTEGTDYEKKNQMKFLISASYYLVVSVVVSAIFYYTK